MTVLLTMALSGCGGGDGPTGPVHGSYLRNNPLAEDLLDHWDDPEPLRRALGLAPVDAADVADRTRAL